MTKQRKIVLFQYCHMADIFKTKKLLNLRINLQIKLLKI